jgi:hypothetical protein
VHDEASRITAQRRRLASESAPQAPGEDPLEAVEVPDPEGILADVELANRCLKGEVGAWESLYAQCHEPLKGAIQRMLGPQGADLSLVDEMAARVWYALVGNDGELLTRYNPKRKARLITFMRSIAKDIIARHVRSEQRRRKREMKVSRRHCPARASLVSETNAVLSEFLVTLSPTERTFADEYLLAPPGQAVRGDSRPSATSIWRLTNNIRQKLADFFQR